MVMVEELVTLRRLTYAVMLHRNIPKSQAVRAIEDLLAADNCEAAAYTIKDDAAFLIEGDARWEVGVNFYNDSHLTIGNVPPDIKVWIELDRFQQSAVDHVGIECAVAARSARFASVEDLGKYIQLGESAMRREQLSLAHEAVDYLLGALHDKLEAQWLASRAPLYDAGLLKIAIDVQKEYWADEGAMPKQETIIAEIREKYDLSEAEAKAVERVACPVVRTRKPLGLEP